MSFQAINKTDRIPQLDVVRSICMIWVVAIWHINDYLSPELQYSKDVFAVLGYTTQLFLATFTFLSGFLLGKYEFNHTNDALIFYKKRIIRFYPLYITAAILFWVMYGGVRKFLFTILGISLLSPPSLSTLWYISMLMVFYFLTPILKWNYRMTWIKLFVPVIIFLAIVIGCKYLNFDLYLLLYSPFYLLGLFSPKKLLTKISKLPVIVLSLFFTIVLLQFQSQNIVLRILFSLSGVVFLVAFCYKCNFTQIESLSSKLSYSSMCAYLFHRPIIWGFIVIRRYFAIGDNYLNVPMAILILIFVFICSFFIQKQYDSIINRYVKV